MSRLTASPFHKPSPFQFPRVPLSPPDTNNESVPPSILSATVSVAGGIDGLPHVEPDTQRPQTSETPGARFRRVGSLAYHTSGLRDSRERGVQRNYRYFVVVIPPPSFVQDHGQLGHTLSLGPQHRLSQGLLMPLFPTMFGQLSAIAREFNFPSTTGLCLYLHFTENGITATPRISDDSWQLIWSHVFDASSPSVKLPIIGKIEFDVDLRQARWYGSWLSSSHREQLDVPSSVVPSTAPSLSHYRVDSRVTELDLMGDDSMDSHSISPPSGESTIPTARHVPKKLSLVDRLDSISVRSGTSRSVRGAAGPSSPPDPIPSSQVLSPIFQEEEPKTATLIIKGDLEKKVNNWRASASLNPTSLAARGQTSLEPANFPNSISLDDVIRDDDADDDEINLEDYAWSVSSFGPPDYDEMESILSWDRVPSVHIANRAEGSVCLTPSTCTSFGPSDYTLPPLSPASERVFTPDLAGRMFYDAPLTPATATSWGAPSEWPPSPLSDGRASSVDFTYRMQLSRPATPSTATSWGAPSEWPASPMSDGRVPSVDFTYRMQLSRPHTPSTATSWGPGSWPPTPATPFFVHTPDAAHRSFDLDSEDRPGAPWRQVWPYTQRKRSQEHVSMNTKGSPWGHVWPYNQTSSGSSLSDVSVYLPCSYPSLVIYQDVYPHFNLYPPVAQVPRHVENVYPHFNLYPSIAITRSSANVQVSPSPAGTQYPVFNIYPAVYPWNLDEIYSAVQLPSSQQPLNKRQGYPHFEIYPPVSSARTISAVTSRPWNHVWPYKAKHQGYPHFEIYPPVSSTRTISTVTSRPWNHVWPYKTKHQGYPHFEIYPPVSSARTISTVTSRPWNHVWPYKTSSPSRSLHVSPWNHVWPYTMKNNSLVSVYLPCSYPSLEIYQQVYPWFNLYPAIPPRKPVQVHYPHFDLYPAVSGAKESYKRPSVALRSVEISCRYPVFNLYPAVYPYNLEEVYPAIRLPAKPKRQHVSLSQGYPDFDIYPAIRSRGYPDFDIYPAYSKKRVSSKLAVDMRSPAKYPYFDLYPAVYPHIVLYPSGEIKISRSTITMTRSSGYPDFEIYPPVKSIGYPDFCIYPPTFREVVKSLKSDIGMKSLSSGYPDFCIYPPISKAVKLASLKSLSSGYPDFAIYPPLKSVGYPDFCIYPPISRKEAKLDTGMKSLTSGYPDFVIYPPLKSVGYPDFCIYPPISRKETKLAKLDNGMKSSTNGYPDFVIYPPLKSVGYPDFCIYPPISRTVTKSIKLNFGSSGYPDFVIYPPVMSVGYPDFCIYPPISTSRRVVRQSKVVIDMEVHSVYPFFNLYPAVYPNLVLYPPRGGEIEKNYSKVYVRHNSRYPVFDLYPAIYPHVVPYPSVLRLKGKLPTNVQVRPVEYTPKYPVFDLYPAVYPYIVPYPPIISLSTTSSQSTAQVTVTVTKQVTFSRPRLTHAELHAIVWSSSSPKRYIKSHRTLHYEVFGNREVHTPSGESRAQLPTVQVEMVRPRSRSSSIARRPPSMAPPVRGLPPRPDSFIQSRDSPSPSSESLRSSPSPSSDSPSPTKSQTSHYSARPNLSLGDPQSIESSRSSPTSRSVSTSPIVQLRRTSTLPARPDSFLQMQDTDSTRMTPAQRSVSMSPTAELRTSTLQRSTSSISPNRPTGLRTSTLQRSVSSASRPTTAPTAELRTTTLQRSMSSASRSTSIRKGPTLLSPVDERPAELFRSSSLNDSHSRGVVDQSSEVDARPRPVHRKRDSLVLQRVKAFENNEDTEPILSKFPLPPRPSGPGLPSRLQTHARRLSTGKS